MVEKKQKPIYSKWMTGAFVAVFLFALFCRLSYLDVFRESVAYTNEMQMYAFTLLKFGTLEYVSPAEWVPGRLAAMPLSESRPIDRDIATMINTIYPNYGEYRYPLIYHMPGLAFMLYIFYKIFGVINFVYFQIFSSIVSGLLGCFLVKKITEMLVPQLRYAPLIATFLYAIHPITMYANVVHDHNSYIILFYLGMVFLALRIILKRGSEIWNFVGLGLIAGISLYFRSDQIQIPAFFIFIYWILNRDLRIAIKKFLAVYSMAFACIFPFMIYKKITFGTYSPLQASGMIAVAGMIGRCDHHNKWGFSEQPPFAGTISEYLQFEKGMDEPDLYRDPTSKGVIREQGYSIYPHNNNYRVPDEWTPWGLQRYNRYVAGKLKVMFQEDASFYWHCIKDYQIPALSSVGTGSLPTGEGFEYLANSKLMFSPLFKNYRFWVERGAPLKKMVYLGLLILLFLNWRLGATVAALLAGNLLPRLPLCINYEYIFGVFAIHLVAVSIFVAFLIDRTPWLVKKFKEKYYRVQGS